MAFTIVYTIKDEKGAQSSTEVNLPATTAFADVVIFAAEMAKLISPLISGQITRIGVAFMVDLPGVLPVAPAGGSDVEEGGRFNFATVNGFRTSLRVPTFLETKVTPNSDTIDQTDGDVLAFVGAITGGIDLTGVGGSGTVQPSDKREEDITALTTAREQFMASRR